MREAISLKSGKAASLFLATQSWLSPFPNRNISLFAVLTIPRYFCGRGPATVVTMTAVNSEGSSSSTLPTPADDLGRYATQLRGEWSMGSPAVALKRLVPDLLGDHHKGQVRRVRLFLLQLHLYCTRVWMHSVGESSRFVTCTAWRSNRLCVCYWLLLQLIEWIVVRL